jgi:predicted ester cyclase
MSLEANRRLIQRLMDEGHNRQDADAASAFYTEDASNHLRTVGRVGMKAVFETLYAVFPDFHYHIEESTHRGQPAVREAFSGMLNDVAPTGKAVTVLQFHSFRLRDGKIAAHAAVRDDMGMVQQLGLVQKP